MSCGKIGHNKCTMAERLSRDSQFNDLPNNEEDEVIITDNNINIEKTNNNKESNSNVHSNNNNNIEDNNDGVNNNNDEVNSIKDIVDQNRKEKILNNNILNKDTELVLGHVKSFKRGISTSSVTHSKSPLSKKQDIYTSSSDSSGMTVEDENDQGDGNDSQDL